MRLLELFDLLSEGRIDFLRDQWSEKLNAQAQAQGEARYAQQYGGGQVFNVLMTADPTQNNKYLQWLIRIYMTGRMRLEDAYKAQEALALFGKFSKRLPAENRDINKVADLNQLFELTKQFEQAQTQGDVDRKLNAEMHSDEHIKLVHDDKEFKVVVPKTKKASCFFGVNTKWCTAATSGYNMFDHYKKRGDLYIVLHKPTNTRWQFHFEDGQFMDEEDRPVDLLKLVKEHPKLREIFGEPVDIAIVEKDPDNIREMPWASDDVLEYAVELQPELVALTGKEPTDRQRMAAIGMRPDLFDQFGSESEKERIEHARDVVQHAYAEDDAEHIHNELGTIEQNYQQRGMTPDVLLRVMDAMQEADIPIQGYAPRSKKFIVEKYKDLKEFFFYHERDFEFAKQVHAEFTGEGGGGLFEVHEVHPDFIDMVWDALDEEDQKTLAKIIWGQYQEHVDEEDYDGYDPEEDYSGSHWISSMLEDSGDPNDYRSNFLSAAYRAEERAMEDEAYQDYMNWIKDIDIESDHYEEHDALNPTIVRPKERDDLDSPVYITVDVEPTVALASELEINQEQMDWSWTMRDFQSGDWYGWNEEAAKESMHEDFWSELRRG